MSLKNLGGANTMIQINKLTQDDLGEAVLYHSFGEPPQKGFITSWNDNFIFVEFRPRTCGRGEACDPEDLTFLETPFHHRKIVSRKLHFEKS